MSSDGLEEVFCRQRFHGLSVSFLAQREVFSWLGANLSSADAAGLSLASFTKAVAGKLDWIWPVLTYDFTKVWRSRETLVVASTEIQLRAFRSLVEGFLLERAAVVLILSPNAKNWATISEFPFSKCRISLPRERRLPTILTGRSLVLMRKMSRDSRQAISLERENVANRSLNKIAQQLRNVESVRKQIKRARPICILTSRPTGLAAALAFAGYLENVPTVFVSHTVLRRNFYDLSVYCSASVPSARCAEMLAHMNPDMKVLVTGDPFNQARAIRPRTAARKPLVIGFMATNLETSQLADLRTLSEVTDFPEIHLHVKCHPNIPHSERAFGAVGSRMHNTAKVFLHEEKRMLDFLRDSDIVVSEKSNSGFDAALAGVPVIYWWTPTRQKISEENSVGVDEVALWNPASREELASIFSQLLQNWNVPSVKALSQSQRHKAENLFPVPSAHCTRDFLIRSGLVTN